MPARITTFLINVLCLSILMVTPVLAAAAEQVNTNSTGEGLLPALPAVQVEAQRIAPTTGTTILDREMIEDLPVRNGSVNELIGIVPGTQYSEEYNSSYLGGEIFPPPVSVSGSRFYDNSYTIDGLNNKSILNPAGDLPDNAYTLPGYPQKQFLNSRLIEEITVYNSNIPAEYGGFTGGHIDVKTVEATPEFWGQLSYRTTNDSWTEFHLDPEKKEDFFKAENSRYQPEFEKHDFGLILNAPLSNDTVFLTAYQKILSRIRLNHIDGPVTLNRERENVLLKATHDFPSNARISFSGLYSPTTATLYLDNVRGSRYAINQDTYSFNLQLEKTLPAGTVTAQAGYSKQRVKRQSPTDKYRWDADDIEGGMGNLAYAQDELLGKLDFMLRTVHWGATNHRIKVGLEAKHSSLLYQRRKGSHYYYGTVEDPLTTCLPEDDACVNGEEYLKNRTVYLAAKDTSTSTDLGFYLQDSMVWKRIELFPGVRISHSNLTNKAQIAPRLSSSLDIFGDGSTVLFAGRNRYYTSTLLEQGHYSYSSQTRAGSMDDWETTSVRDFVDKDIEAPYADETTVGIIQKLFGGEFKAQYIQKDHHKEFARTSEKSSETYLDENGDQKTITHYTYYLNNNGRSEYESILISWQRSWARHYFEANGNWQISTSSNNDYSGFFDEEDATETYWYEGKEYFKYEMPKSDFNRPVVLNFIYRCKLPYAISFTNTTKYRGKYWRLKNSGERQASLLNPEQATDPFIYQKVKAKSALTFDWNLRWQVPEFSRFDVVLNLDVLNVFNKKIKIRDYGGEYELGRQFWAGIDFNF